VNLMHQRDVVVDNRIYENWGEGGGMGGRWSSDFAAEVGFGSESLDLYRALGDTRAVARALLVVGAAPRARRDAPGLEECLALAREVHDRQNLRLALVG